MRSEKSRVLAGAAVVLTVLAFGAAPAAADDPAPPPLDLPPVEVPPMDLPVPIPGVPALSAPGITVDVGTDGVAPAIPPVDTDVRSTATDDAAAAAPVATVSPAEPAPLPAAPAPSASEAAPSTPDAPPLPDTPAAADGPTRARPAYEVVSDNAQASVVLLLIFALLSMFALMHGRPDERDAKLVAAPVDDDRLGFG